VPPFNPKNYIVQAIYRRSKCDYLTDAGCEALKVKSMTGQTQWSERLRGCDCIIHLAAIAHKKGIMNNPEEYRVVNVESVLNLATQAADAGVSRFIFISSVGVNGNKTLHNPFSESDAPNPSSVYAIAKYHAEMDCKRLLQEWGWRL